jgi:hypothetical protein
LLTSFSIVVTSAALTFGGDFVFVAIFRVFSLRFLAADSKALWLSASPH